MKNIGKTKPLDLTGQGFQEKISFQSDDGLDRNNYSNIYHNCQEDFLVNQNHYHELVELSGIDPGIVALNFQSLDGNITHEYLLSDALKKLSLFRG